MRRASLSAGAGDDMEWFDELYRVYSPRMVRLAFVLVGDSAVAEELAQEAFLQVFRSSSDISDAVPYLRSAVYNVCKNHFRAESRRRRRRVLYMPSETPPGGDHVIDVIRRLPGKQQAYVILRYYEGMTDNEISSATGSPVGSVKSSLHRALTAMRKELR